MTASLYQDIEGALETRLNTVPGLPAVAAEGQTYNPTAGVPFVEPVHIPISSPPTTNGDQKIYLHEGLFQIAVVYPVTKGRGPAVAMADLIKSYFTPGTVLTKGNAVVRFRSAQRSRALIDSQWVRIPVSIAWYLHSQTN